LTTGHPGHGQKQLHNGKACGEAVLLTSRRLWKYSAAVSVAGIFSYRWLRLHNGSTVSVPHRRSRSPNNDPVSDEDYKLPGRPGYTLAQPIRPAQR